MNGLVAAMVHSIRGSPRLSLPTLSTIKLEVNRDGKGVLPRPHAEEELGLRCHREDERSGKGFSRNKKAVVSKLPEGGPVLVYSGHGNTTNAAKVRALSINGGQGLR